MLVDLHAGHESLALRPQVSESLGVPGAMVMKAEWDLPKIRADIHPNTRPLIINTPKNWTPN